MIKDIFLKQVQRKEKRIRRISSLLKKRLESFLFKTIIYLF